METILDETIARRDITPRTPAQSGHRIVALLVDGGILVGISIATFIPTLYEPEWIGIALLRMAMLIMILVYKPTMELWQHATVGKRLVKIEVVASSFDKLQLKEVLVRNILFICFFGSMLVVQLLQIAGAGSSIQFGADVVQVITWVLVAIGTLVDLAAMIFDDNHRSLQDRLAGTMVVDSQVHASSSRADQL